MWEHHNRVAAMRRAREAAAKAGKESPAAASFDGKVEKGTHDLLLKEMAQYCKRISDLPYGQPREDLKIKLVNEYMPVIEKLIEKEVASPAVTQVMIWCFDIDDIATGLKYGKIAIERNIPMPERFDRDVKTFVADQVIQWVALRDAKDSVEPFFSDVYSMIFDKENPWRIHEQILIKFHKVKINQLEKDGKLEAAYKLCEECESINPVIAKVKTQKERLAKAIKKNTETNE